MTNAQYAEFLNTVAKTDTHALYSASMSSDARGGINRSGTAGSYTYAVKAGRGNNPVVFVSQYDALRFANWLHNGQPMGAQGPATTEDGAYSFLGDTPVHARKPGARNFLPTENEWFKAAHYDPALRGYYQYATRTNVVPSSDPPPGAGNSANCRDPDGDFALTGSGTFVPTFNYLTNVGAYTGSASPYGTFDQAGNANEWTETPLESIYALVMGSSWSGPCSDGSTFGGDLPSRESAGGGFRVAQIGPVPPLIWFDNPSGSNVLGVLLMGSGELFEIFEGKRDEFGALTRVKSILVGISRTGDWLRIDLDRAGRPKRISDSQGFVTKLRRYSPSAGTVVVSQKGPDGRRSGPPPTASRRSGQGAAVERETGVENPRRAVREP